MKDTSIRCTKENAASDDRASQASSPAPSSAGHATSLSPTAEEVGRTLVTQRTPSADAQSRLKRPRCRFTLPGKPILCPILASVVALLSVLLLLLALIPTPPAQAGGPTDVGGVLDTDTTWTAADSPYIVTGNVVVSSGVTLTIESGVIVKFGSGKGMQVNGMLVARGTASDPITFTTSLATPVAGAWLFINFTDSSVDATFDGGGNYVSGSVLQYCKVLYGGGSGVSGAIQLDSAAPFIDHCEIKNNAQSGIWAQNAAGLHISNNIISDNNAGTGGGIHPLSLLGGSQGTPFVVLYVAS